jgi:membrane protease YdiL (CAAX protease family)
MPSQINNAQVPKPGYMLPVWILCAVAALFWLLMFYPWPQPPFNFWAIMLTATLVLAGSALWLGRRERAEVYRFCGQHLLIGILSVPLLYAFFWGGKHLAVLILPFSPEQISGIYATKSQAPAWLIGLLLLTWIGPAEEIFWRGFVQHRLMRRYGTWGGFIVATVLYTLIHIWAGNLMLLAAAGVAGVFWGLMYLRYRSVWPGLISHALWDALIFVIAPLQQ